MPSLFEKIDVIRDELHKQNSALIEIHAEFLERGDSKAATVIDEARTGVALALFRLRRCYP